MVQPAATAGRARLFQRSAVSPGSPVLATPARTPPPESGWVVQLTRDQTLALELGPRLVQRDVGRGEDHVGGDELIVADLRPPRAHIVDEPAEDVAEGGVVACLA